MPNYKSVSNNKRQIVRVPVNKTGYIFNRGTSEKCTVLDISMEGIGLKVKSIYDEADKIEIFFNLEEDIDIRAKINVTFANGSRLGGKISDLADSHKNEIKKYILKKMPALKGFLK